MLKATVTAAVAGVLMSACCQSAQAFPWSIDMYRSAAVQPLARAPRVMPDDTIPTDHGEPPMSREQASAQLHNPLSPSSDNLKYGKQLYLTNCAPCHGNSGAGDGPAIRILIRPPGNLLSDAIRKRNDGYIYATIRDGGVVMPSYGDVMSSHERWQVVLFVRALQYVVAERDAGQK
ncbi:MAG TPA: c-type cytochrome [Candidatus Binataceae bacterium]